MFLALGLGILVGTTVLDDSLLDSLRVRTEQLQQQASDLREQLDAALQETAQMERFAADQQAFILPNTLPGTAAVLVTTEGAEADALDEAVAALDLAGARVAATITVQPSMTAANGSDAQELAELLGLPADTSPEDLMAAAAADLAERIAVGPLRPVAPEEDLLGAMLGAGFVVAPGISDAGLADVGGPGQVVLAVGGVSPAGQPVSEGFLMPFVAELVEREVTTVAAEGSDRTSTFLSTTIDRAGSDALVTIDGLDGPVGGTALVLGIARAALTGEGGAWGIGDQAADPLPPP